MELSEVKTSIDGLEVGMYVSRLDRPWIKTPFPIQGLKIRSKDDIEKLRAYCSFVYVDVEKGHAPNPRFWIVSSTPKASTNIFDMEPSERPVVTRTDEFESLRKKTYRVTTSIKSELKEARTACDKVSEGFSNLLEDLGKGRDIDLAAVKTGITDMVESITRNPAALSWLVHLKKHDEYTYSRALGTSVWCATFGRHLGLEKSTITELALGGLLLDIGNTTIPRELIFKLGGLDDDEQKQMHSHVDMGVKILAHASSTSPTTKVSMDVLQMVATHHERFDGSGYPQKLGNEQIPLYGKIAGLVDSYDAMTSERPYAGKGPRPPHEAIAELYELRDDKYQGELVEQFIQSVGLYPTGSLVELNTGEVGAVISVNGLRRLRPVVMLLLDENKKPLSQFKNIDISKTKDINVTRGVSPDDYGINMKELFL
ncbi:MAG: HD-GYP domain-containing protein [Sedimenticola sp.]